MTIGVRHDDLRRRNRAMVIGAIRRTGQPSRTEIAAATGLSHSTISSISADLIAEGILMEARTPDSQTARRGRPQVAMALNPAFIQVVSVMLLLNRIAATAIDYAGGIIATHEMRMPTAVLSREALIAAVLDCIAVVAPQAPTRVTLAVQGITDSASTSMLWSPITPHTNIPFAAELSRRIGAPVTVENDCNMIALALKWRAPERYRDDFFAILLSDGIGMGIVVKGSLFTGTHSSGAEFGHMIHVPNGALCRCGRKGCVEAYAGNYAVMRAARGLPPDSEPDADIGEEQIRCLADAARAADGPERRAFVKAGEAIGFGLGSLFALFDPAPVAIVGQGALAFDMLEAPIRDAISRTAGGQHSGAISFEALPDEAPLIREGGAMHALTFVDHTLAAPGAASQRAGRR